MGNHHLRHDKTCENCGYTVDIAYCSNCGQKNVETRQSFGHLVSHFAEDLTHYDSAFWSTIKFLLFRPGRLTIDYLSGRRQRYVPPVKLYIFISFIAFFIPALLPDGDDDAGASTDVAEHHPVAKVHKPIKMNEKESVWLFRFNSDEPRLESPLSYNSIRQMDSVEALKPDSLRLSSFEYKLARKLILRHSQNSDEELLQKFMEAFPHHIPKALFLYMPVFGLWLWLLHGKKRWYFFDHGIFTLHYFSFLLLTITIMILLWYLTLRVDNMLFDIISFLLTVVVFFYSVFYFFRAHRKMYLERLIVNFTKCTLLLVINLISMLIAGVILVMYTYHNLH